MMGKKIKSKEQRNWKEGNTVENGADRSLEPEQMGLERTHPKALE